MFFSDGKAIALPIQYGCFLHITHHSNRDSQRHRMLDPQWLAEMMPLLHWELLLA